MFEASQLIFYYSTSPVHMGAGSAIGAIDSPIQREVHTKYPSFAGSGLKGALRHHFNQSWRDESAPVPAPSNPLIARIFGPDPESNASDFAGALSLTDAQLLALPVRSLKGGFAYVTSPLALARLQRLATQAGLTVDWQVPPVAENQALVASANLLQQDKKLILEAFEFKAVESEPLKKIATWIANHALPPTEHAFFNQKMQNDLVLLNDTDFSHFARHAMVVEAHVRINDESGTAQDGGLFYVENLPPETLMVGLMQASIERFKKGSRDNKEQLSDLLKADEVLDRVLMGDTKNNPASKGINGKILQIGGDATTGRGLVLVQAAHKDAKP